ncbi:hypothetical protein THIOSC13_1910006 [uncultured Thiomicrorhabdus sp.]
MTMVTWVYKAPMCTLYEKEFPKDETPVGQWWHIVPTCTREVEE